MYVRHCELHAPGGVYGKPSRTKREGVGVEIESPAAPGCASSRPYAGKGFFLEKKRNRKHTNGGFFRNSFFPLSTIFCTRSISFRVTLVQPRRRRATRVLAKRESHCGEKSVRQCRFACKNRLRAETLPTTGVEPRSYNGQRSAQHSAYGARRNERNRTNTGKRSNNSFRFGFLFRHTLVVSRIFSRVHTIVTSHKL